MDEISLFATLRPAPPADADAIRNPVRAKVTAGLTTPEVRRSGAGPAWRGYRPLAVLGTAAAVAAGAAVVVPSMLPGGNPGSFVTAAWAVARDSQGTVTVTLRRTFAHQHELQTDLRADDVPAYVRSLAHCVWRPKGGRKQIFVDARALRYRNVRHGSRLVTEVVIHPSRIPHGDAVFIGGTKYRGGGFAIQSFLMPNDSPPVCTHSDILVQPYDSPAPSPSPSPSPSVSQSASPSQSTPASSPSS